MTCLVYLIGYRGDVREWLVCWIGCYVVESAFETEGSFFQGIGGGNVTAIEGDVGRRRWGDVIGRPSCQSQLNVQEMPFIRG